MTQKPNIRQTAERVVAKAAGALLVAYTLVLIVQTSGIARIVRHTVFLDRALIPPLKQGPVIPEPSSPEGAWPRRFPQRRGSFWSQARCCFAKRTICAMASRASGNMSALSCQTCQTFGQTSIAVSTPAAVSAAAIRVESSRSISFSPTWKRVGGKPETSP